MNELLVAYEYYITVHVVGDHRTLGQSSCVLTRGWTYLTPVFLRNHLAPCQLEGMRPKRCHAPSPEVKFAQRLVRIIVYFKKTTHRSHFLSKSTGAESNEEEDLTCPCIFPPSSLQIQSSLNEFYKTVGESLFLLLIYSRSFTSRWRKMTLISLTIQMISLTSLLTIVNHADDKVSEDMILLMI